ncbi:MAG: hypothetical protein NTW29_07355 [Bacteroidetes bacterium]|nr:hypothetical protein [Bacteroidota bacterium]
MKKITLLLLLVALAGAAFSQTLSPESKLAVNTISGLLPRLYINEQYTRPIGIEEFARVRQDWDIYMENHNAAVAAWNKIARHELQHPEVIAIRKPLADRITFFQQWTAQLKATQKIINDNPAAFSTPEAVLSETSREKLKQIGPLLAGIEIKPEYSGVLLPSQYVPAAEWFLKIKGNYIKATGLLASLQKIERPHPDAMKEEEKLLAIQAVYLNVEKQLKAAGNAQTNSGIRKMWADDVSKYKDAVLIFADVLGIDLPQNTSNSRTLFELTPDNYDKTLKDLEALSMLMTGNYKDLVDNFSHVFPTLENSPCVYRMVAVNRKALIPEVVKLSASRFMANAMHGAPDITDLEKQEGWMDGSFTPAESKLRLTEIKSRFLPVLKKAGISEKEAGLDQLDTAYNTYWRKAEELAPRWAFPTDANASGDARAKLLFTNNIKSAYPGVQIIKLGFAYDAKWTVYINEFNQPRHRTIGTTALIKLPGEKYYTAWQLLFNEDYAGGGKFSGGSIQWLKWRWQTNK